MLTGRSTRLTVFIIFGNNAGVVVIGARIQTGSIGHHMVVDGATLHALVGRNILGVLAHLAQVVVEAPVAAVWALLHSDQ